MTFSRALGVGALAGVLAACGGDQAGDDIASDTVVVVDTVAASSDTAGAMPDPGAVPPFVVGDDTAAAVDTTTGIRSVYTSLAEADCRVVDRDEETGGVSQRCPGTGGYALLVHDYDARMTVDVVTPNGGTHRLRYSSVISSAFSSLGPRAEWRMRDGKPVALIVRVNAFEVPETPEVAISYLAVAKLTARETCVTDRIAPSATANEAAREAADASASRPCRPGTG